jgi:hypothetical protein
MVNFPCSRVNLCSRHFLETKRSEEKHQSTVHFSQKTKNKTKQKSAVIEVTKRKRATFGEPE